MSQSKVLLQEPAFDYKLSRQIDRALWILEQELVGDVRAIIRAWLTELEAQIPEPTP